MAIKTLCLGAARAASGGIRNEPEGVRALRDAARALMDATPALTQAQRLVALRHIPSDSVNASRSYTGVTAEAEGIETVIELYFETEEAMRGVVDTPAWKTFLARVDAVAPLLFSLDTHSNVPIPARGAAERGGFRRWMLLARKADTHPQFRDAWFGRHADLVKHLPHVDGYLQNLVQARFDAAGRAVDYAAMPIDGVAELCFADEAAMNSAYTSDARLPLRDDGRELLGRITTILVQGEALA